MRQRTSILLLSALLTAGCVVTHPIDFTTPESTVATFQSAFARDDEFAEYDCFANEVKSGGLSQEAWSLERARVFDSFGWFGRSVLRRNDLADNVVERRRPPAAPLLSGLPIAGGGRVPGTGRDGGPELAYELASHGLRVTFAVERTLEVHAAIGSQGRAFPFDPTTARIEESPVGRSGRLVLEIDVPASLARELAVTGANRIVLSRRYKLRWIEPLDAKDRVALEPLPKRPPRRRAIVGAPFRPTIGTVEFGIARARFELPLPEALSFAEFDVDELRWECAPSATSRPERPATGR